MNEFFFYEPKYDLKPAYNSNIYFLPEIKTHKHNIMLGRPSPDNINISADMMSAKAIFMGGRKDNINELLNDLNRVYKEDTKEYVLIRGTIGSGKSLFIRKTLFDFVEMNRDIKQHL
jgi:hypothetical protein